MNCLTVKIGLLGLSDPVLATDHLTSPPMPSQADLLLLVAKNSHSARTLKSCRLRLRNCAEYIPDWNLANNVLEAKEIVFVDHEDTRTALLRRGVSGGGRVGGGGSGVGGGLSSISDGGRSWM